MGYTHPGKLSPDNRSAFWSRARRGPRWQSWISAQREVSVAARDAVHVIDTCYGLATRVRTADVHPVGPVQGLAGNSTCCGRQRRRQLLKRQDVGVCAPELDTLEYLLPQDIVVVFRLAARRASSNDCGLSISLFSHGQHLLPVYLDPVIFQNLSPRAHSAQRTQKSSSPSHGVQQLRPGEVTVLAVRQKPHVPSVRVSG